MKKSIITKTLIFGGAIGLLLMPMSGKVQIKKPIKPKPILLKMPDLTVSIKCPSRAYPGQELGKSIRVVVENRGMAVAKDFFVDLVISSDTTIPVKYANYSPNFHEDVLFKGGRTHISSLAAGVTINVKSLGAKIPDDIPFGIYYLGAVVDPGKKVKELNENNNTALCRIKIEVLIKKVKQWITSPASRELDITGEGFGDTQGSKIVRMGTYTLDVWEWHNDGIGTAIPRGIEYGKTYRIYLQDGGKIISNIFTYLLLKDFDSIDPLEASPGAVIAIRGFGFGTTRGANKLKIGTAEAPVISWSNSEIRARVPAMAPGTYKVYIEDGGRIISEVMTFKVIS